ncbi:MAG: hypothetical protein MJE68_20075, partial [Proteobacteria bacterium]|nr:hypothetical protein [Pseudomonadota bacterium]
MPIVRKGGRSPPKDLPFTLLDTGSLLHAERVCSSEKAICITVSGVQQEDCDTRPHPGNQVVWF